MRTPAAAGDGGLQVESGAGVSSDLLPALLQLTHVGVVQADADGRFTRVNPHWLELTGYEEAEMKRLAFLDVTHPESVPAAIAQVERVRTGAPGCSLRRRYVRKDGSTFWANTTVSTLRDAGGRLTGYVALVHDLTDERRGRRLVERQNEALRLIIAGAPLAGIFGCLIAALEDEGEAVGSVLLLDHARRCLRHGAAPGLPYGYNRAIDGLPIDPDAATCAAAVARDRIVVTPDIATDPGWQPWKHLPLALGLRAAWALPIRSAAGRVLGAFGIYFRRCRRPTEAEIEAVTRLARTAAMAIERHETGESFRMAMEERDRQRRLYETVLSHTPDLVYVFNLEHRFTYANAALLATWGRTWEESIGKNCLELGYEPWHAAMHDREIDEVVATRRPVRGVVAFNGTNGRRLYDYIFAPVIGAGGEVEAIAGTTRDVTEHRKAAATVKFLGDLTQRLAVITEEREIIRETVGAVGRQIGAHRCYFVECVENDDRITVSENWVRDEAATLAGSFSLFDFGGRDWWRAYSRGEFAVEDTENDRRIDRARAAHHAALGVRAYAVRAFKRSDEAVVVLAVTENQPRTWTEEEMRLLESVIARVWPMVERARSEAALRIARDEALAASRAKDNFLATLSHELRTPLNPVLLLASEAAADATLPAAVRTDFETIARNVTLEARLIDDLLDLTRIAHDKLTLNAVPLDAHGVLRHVLGTMRQEARAKRIELATHLDAAASGVAGDDARLQQVFFNVLRNAVKFTPAGGRIDVGTANPADRPGVLAIDVSDTGIGLTAEELTRVFDPFAQGSAIEGGDGSRYGGLGLGLAIARKIAELHGGSLTGRSGGRGQGATFRLELPLGSGQAGPAAAPAAAPAGQPPRAAPRRILLVEDHEPSRLALGRLLRNRGMDVVHAASVAEAVRCAAEGLFDLVISDLGLPDGNGCDLLRTLRAAHGCRGIALSGYGAEADVGRSREAGFLAHLTKPVQVAALERALEQVRRA